MPLPGEGREQVGVETYPEVFWMSKRATEKCPKCGSESLDLRTRKSEFTAAIWVTVIGLLLSIISVPVLIVVVPAAIYLFFTAARAKPTYTCLTCKHRWPATELEATGPQGKE